MPTPQGTSLPSYIPTPLSDTSFPPTHVAQQQQSSATRSTRRAEDSLELERLSQATPDSGHDSGSSRPSRRGRPEPLHLRTSQDQLDRDWEDSSEADENTTFQMGRRKSKSPNVARSGRSSSPEPGQSPSGHASGAMIGLEQRRKHASLDSPAASLMSRHSINLDDPVPPPEQDSSSKGFFELPRQDRRNFLLLVLLYFLQGIPMGLASGSVPFLLKSHVSYSEIGVFSLASYPYSLKLLWSPIVDAIWTPKLGRRKSWILPIQTLSGLGMLWLSGHVEAMMNAAGSGHSGDVWNFTWWWFSLVFMCATQDIAVDGWALTLLSHENISFASTAQSVGLTAGQFLSYTIFLAFNSADFSNKWFRPANSPSAEGLITLPGYLRFWGWAYLVITLGLAVLKREERTKNNDGIMEVYRTMGGILKLKNIQTLIIIHLIAKIGFQANDAVTNLKLLDKGFSQEDLALTVLIDFPFEISLGYYAAKWCQDYSAMQVWCWAFVGRLLAAGFAQLVVMIFPAGGVTTWYLLTVIVEHIFSTFMNTVMFVAVSAFHAKISDPVIGGTYMTLLATVSNLGGTFPRYFVLKFVDFFTEATCVPPAQAPPDFKGELITQPFSCVGPEAQNQCKAGGGTCNITRDGFYIVNVLCIIFGVVTFWGYIKPAALKLQALPVRAWRLAGAA